MITHVAIKYGRQIWSLPRPMRHHHILRDMHEYGIDCPKWDEMAQGFLDHDGSFLTRDEAEQHARACGQIVGDIIGGQLTSEDLW